MADRVKNSKYGVVSRGKFAGALYNRATGERIPDDEPVFILRAKDAHAPATIAFYEGLVESTKFRNLVSRVRKSFEAWQRKRTNKVLVKAAD